MKAIATTTEMTMNEKIMAIPQSFDMALNSLKDVYANFKRNGVYLAISINHAIDAFQREFGLKSISDVLKHETWKAKFDLGIEDRMVRSYNRTGKIAQGFLKHGIEIPVSKLEKYASILEKREYQKVIDLKAEKLAEIMNSPTIDPVSLESELINQFALLPKPTIDTPTPEILEYKENSLKVSQNHEKLQRAVEVAPAKVKTISLSKDDMIALLSSLNVPSAKSAEIINHYFKG